VWVLCVRIQFKIFLRSWGSIYSTQTHKIESMQCSWGITKSQNLIHKCSKTLHSKKKSVASNIRVGIVFQRYFNLGDKMQVRTLCLVFGSKNDKMWSRTQSGNIIEHQTRRSNLYFVLKIQYHWKTVATLILHYSNFSTMKRFVVYIGV
jgi:hypothetical protein